MSADLEEINGKIAFVAARGEPGWHNLGTVVPGDIEVDDFLRLAALDNWNVVKVPMTLALPAKQDTIEDPETGELIVVTTEYQHVDMPDRYVTRRMKDGKVLGTNIGPQYEPFQCEQVLELADFLVGGNGNLVPDTAGSIMGGSRFFLAFRIDGAWNLHADPHQPYLGLVSSHDGSLALTGMATPVRIVCGNTANMALRDAAGRLGLGAFRIHHRSRIEDRREEMRAALDVALAYVDAYQAEADVLMHTPIETRDFDLVLDGLFPITDQTSLRAKGMRTGNRTVIRRLYEDSPQVGEFKGTAWGAIQAVSTWEQWFAPVRTGDHTESTARSLRQLDAVLTDGFGRTEQARKILAAATIG